MPIEPDTKDWTWVLERRCPECGFDATTVDPVQVGGMIRANAATWQQVLARSRAELTTRPDDATWSALEYACHVRDVFRIYDHRLRRMLTEDGPTFPNWDQDEAAVADRYAEQDPTVVAGELAAAGAVLADRFDTVDGAQWARTGDRSDGASFTVESFARYLIHDPVHHVDDVDKGFAAIAASAGGR
jgi:hypothetical protein